MSENRMPVLSRGAYISRIFYINSGVFMCDGIDFEFPGRNESAKMVCLVGENGVGKTTILNSMQLALIPSVQDMDLRSDKNQGVRGRSSDMEFFFPSAERSYIFFEFKNCPGGTRSICVYRDNSMDGHLRRISFDGGIDYKPFITEQKDGGISVNGIRDKSVAEFWTARKARKIATNEDYFDFLSDSGIYSSESSHRNMKTYFKAYVDVLVTRTTTDKALHELMYNSAWEISKTQSSLKPEVDIDEIRSALDKMRTTCKTFELEEKGIRIFKKLEPLMTKYGDARTDMERILNMVALSYPMHVAHFQSEREIESLKLSEYAQQHEEMSRQLCEKQQVLAVADDKLSTWKTQEKDAAEYLALWRDSTELEKALNEMKQQISEKKTLLEKIGNAEKCKTEADGYWTSIEKKGATDCASVEKIEQEIDGLQKRIKEIKPEVEKLRPVEAIGQSMEKISSDIKSALKTIGFDEVPADEQLLDRKAEAEKECKILRSEVHARTQEIVEKEFGENSKRMDGYIERLNSLGSEIGHLIDDVSTKGLRGKLDSVKRAFDSLPPVENISLTKSSNYIRKEISNLSAKIENVRKQIVSTGFGDIPEAYDDIDSMCLKLKGELEVLHQKLDGMPDEKYAGKEVENTVKEIRKIDSSDMSASEISSFIGALKQELEAVQSSIHTNRSTAQVKSEIEDLISRLHDMDANIASIEKQLKTAISNRDTATMKKSFSYQLIDSGISPENAVNVVKVLGEIKAMSVSGEYAGRYPGQSSAYIATPFEIAKSILSHITDNIYDDGFFKIDLNAVSVPDGIDLEKSEESVAIERVDMLTRKCDDLRTRREKIELSLEDGRSELELAEQREIAICKKKEIEEKLAHQNKLYPLRVRLEDWKNKLELAISMRPEFERRKLLDECVPLLESLAVLLKQYSNCEEELPDVIRAENFKKMSEFVDVTLTAISVAESLEVLKSELEMSRCETKIIERVRELEGIIDSVGYMKSKVATYNELVKECEKSLEANPLREEIKTSEKRIGFLRDAEIHFVPFEKKMDEFKQLGGYALVNQFSKTKTDLSNLFSKQLYMEKAKPYILSFEKTGEECREKYAVSSVHEMQEFIAEEKNKKAEMETCVTGIVESIKKTERIIRCISDGLKAFKEMYERITKQREYKDAVEAMSLNRFKNENPLDKSPLKALEALDGITGDDMFFLSREDSFLDSCSDIIRKRWGYYEETLSNRAKECDRLVSHMKSNVDKSGLTDRDSCDFPTENTYGAYSRFFSALKERYSDEKTLREHHEKYLESIKNEVNAVTLNILTTIKNCKACLEMFGRHLTREMKSLGGTQIDSIVVSVLPTKYAKQILAGFDVITEHVKTFQMQLDFDEKSPDATEKTFRGGEYIEKLLSDIGVKSKIAISELFTISIKRYDISGKEIEDTSPGNSTFSGTVLNSTILRMLETHGNKGSSKTTMSGFRKSMLPISLDESGKIDVRNKSALLRYLDKAGFFVISAEPADSFGTDILSDVDLSKCYKLTSYRIPGDDYHPERKITRISEPACYRCEEKREEMSA